jgi:hypothetical protein
MKSHYPGCISDEDCKCQDYDDEAKDCDPSDTPRTDAACAYLIRQNKKDHGYADMARYSVLGVQSLLATAKSLERELTSEKWRVRALEDVMTQCLAMAEAWEDSDGGKANDLIAALRGLSLHND